MTSEETMGERRYVCENCKRLGALADFRDECKPGWTHGRLIGAVVDAPAVRAAAETTAERQQRFRREAS